MFFLPSTTLDVVRNVDIRNHNMLLINFLVYKKTLKRDTSYWILEIGPQNLLNVVLYKKKGL